MHKTPYVFPIVGGRKVDHLKGNIEALELELTDEEVEEINAAGNFQVGFPLNMIFEFSGQKYDPRMTTSDVDLIKMCGTIVDSVEKPRPIAPHKD